MSQLDDALNLAMAAVTSGWDANAEQRFTAAQDMMADYQDPVSQKKFRELQAAVTVARVDAAKQTVRQAYHDLAAAVKADDPDAAVRFSDTITDAKTSAGVVASREIRAAHEIVGVKDALQERYGLMLDAAVVATTAAAGHGDEVFRGAAEAFGGLVRDAQMIAGLDCSAHIEALQNAIDPL